MSMRMKCPVCGYLTIEEKWDICPVCFWEYEGDNETEESGANHGLTIAKARENYKWFGACEPSMIPNVRPPFESEVPEGEDFSEAERVTWDIYLKPFFKSIIEQDRCAVVICNLSDEIIYMNPAAKARYAKHGDLIGKSIMDCHNERSCEMIAKVRDWFAKSPDNNMIYTFHNEKQNKDVYMVALRDKDGRLIGYYEKHEFRDPETMNRYAFNEENE